MNIKLSIKVFSENNKQGLQYEKTYKSIMPPHIGEKIKDSLFAELKEVIDVIYDYSKEEVKVVLPDKEVPDDRLEGHIQEVAEMHNWVIIE